MVTACKEHTKVVQDSTPSQYDSDTAGNASAVHTWKPVIGKQECRKARCIVFPR